MKHRQTTMYSRTSIFADAREIIRQVPRKDLAAQQVAHAIGTSTRQLQRAFEQHGGMTFQGFRAATSMDHAALLLRTTNMSVRDTASAVGYSQPAAFAKAFRRHHGISPTEYRLREQPDGSAARSGQWS